MPYHEYIYKNLKITENNIKKVLLKIIDLLVPKTQGEIFLHKQYFKNLDIDNSSQLYWFPIEMLQSRMLEFKTFEPRITNHLEEKFIKEKERNKLRKERKIQDRHIYIITCNA